MKILFVYPNMAIFGGLERVWADKANYLVQLYHYEVCILTYNQGCHPVPYQLDEKITHIDLNVRTHQKYRHSGLRRMYEGLRLHRQLRRCMKTAIRQIKPDVIVTSTIEELSFLLNMHGNTPLVIESHNGHDNIIISSRVKLLQKLSLRRFLQRLKYANAIIALTEVDAKKWEKHNQHVYCIPNIVHLNPTGRYSTGNKKRIVFAGRFSEQKGIPELLSVWKIIHQRHPDWQLDVYGQGDDSYFLHLPDGVNIFNPVNDIFEKYLDSSILILTSRWEPFGLVLPEAMSCGLPVVAFECDGPCSIITDGKDGFLIRDRNICAFADRVCQLIEDETLRHQMSAQAILSAQRYTPEQIMPQWKSFYELLIHK